MVCLIGWEGKYWGWYIFFGRNFAKKGQKSVIILHIRIENWKGCMQFFVKIPKKGQKRYTDPTPLLDWFARGNTRKRVWAYADWYKMVNKGRRGVEVWHRRTTFPKWPHCYEDEVDGLMLWVVKTRYGVALRGWLIIIHTWRWGFY